MNKQVMTKTFDELRASFKGSDGMSRVLYDECERLTQALIELRVKVKNTVYDLEHCNVGETENGCEKFIYLDDVNSALYENGFDTLSTPSEG